MSIVYYRDENVTLAVDPDHVPPDMISNPARKTVKQLIQDDISAGSNKTGYRKYVKVFIEHSILSLSEVNTWRTKLPMEEADSPKISNGV